MIAAVLIGVVLNARVARADESNGADTKWWSLQPLQRPPLPAVKNTDWPRNEMDRFVLARLEANGLKPSPPADRRTLIRRLYFDLIGLPPTPEEVDAFVASSDELAYEQLVDRLLASPHYGERWARHWLDVVHYGETHGYDKDKPREHAWPYRDYVIRAFNEDKPYGRFVQEQLAGDVLFPGTRDGVEALGFIAAGPWDFIGHAELPESKIDGKVARHLDRDDMVATTANTFLSLTVQCAQCHTHKFDPISQEDYYSLQAVFAALDRADKPYYIDPQIAGRESELRARRRELERKQEALNDLVKPLGGHELEELDRKTRESKTKQQLEEMARGLAEIDAELAALPPPKLVYAGTVHHGSGSFTGTGSNGGRPREIRILARGDVTRPGKLVGPGALSALATLSARFELPVGHREGDRRAALAHWLTGLKNPLTWRSIVNRVWHYHFGRGIVDTPNDFGRMGQLPTHPELLDWLAIEVRDGGQSIKSLHRLIVTSATYRQTSDIVPSAKGSGAQSIDADNRYYWRINRRRLEAEAIRDSILAVSGKLDRTMFGPSFQDFVIEKPEHSPHYQYHLHDANDARSHRRSVYRFLVRSRQQPFMAALDCADPSMAVEKRNHTVTPLQALALLNNQFVVVMAQHFAARAAQTSRELEGQVKSAFRMALARNPTEREQRTLVDYAQEHGLPNACRVIFNLNEFVFVD
jgi:hypothetical protein